MKCSCCDRILTDFEATRKHAVVGCYIDLCQRCFKTVQQDANLPTKDRRDLITSDDIDDSVDDDNDDNDNLEDHNDERDNIEGY